MQKALYNKLLSLKIFLFLSLTLSAQEIPLPEHPRPDFQREQWINLNGSWDFAYDSLDQGLENKWFAEHSFDRKIMVPFPWGSELSGIEDLADIGWYSREIEVPQRWEGKRTFLVIGACDWHTTVWLDGILVGTHQGGYNQFDFDLTDFILAGESHQLVIRVDDSPHPYKLEGKQGYGEAKGIWQTTYLEQRGDIAFEYVHITPDIDRGNILVEAKLDQKAPEHLYVNLSFPNREITGIITSPRIQRKQDHIAFEVDIPDPHLWELDDPYLYDVKIQLHNNDNVYDNLATYFGMRKVSMMDLPGTEFPYVALNNKPVYLQLSLDQAYHPEGFYTYPSDEFMRDEILRSKKIGLNGNRIHIKVEIPRKLYWADKLGLLIMADVPNFWGEPGAEAKKEWEYAMRKMIARDYNHPSIFSWVLFNETWGLATGKGDEREYLPSTQDWVRDMFMEAQMLDESRLIEDNSPNKEDHVVTDLNTWHSYLPGYAWEKFLNEVDEKTYVGSGWNFIGDNKQTKVPMFNSECGNVWGYEGSAGDVDWSWDYHIMMNEFRKHPKIAGWLYTEHHDVINEWNGYYKYDRTEKYTGFEAFIPDMKLNHLHSYVYLSTGSELCRQVSPGETVDVPLYLSVMTERVPGDHFILDYELSGHDTKGKFNHIMLKSKPLKSAPYFNGSLEPLQVEMPSNPGLYHLTLRLKDENAMVYHLNFTSFLVEGKQIHTGKSDMKNVVSFHPASFSKTSWTEKQWNIFDGLKVNGAGSGSFTYQVVIPEEIDLDSTKRIMLVFEASAKKLHGKDRDEKTTLGGDYMRGRGTFDPSRNPNSYPMTDTYLYPSLLNVRVNGKVVGEFHLKDDPADHRGVLSWYSQKKNRKLQEAGSYGYLCKCIVPADLVRNQEKRTLEISFEVGEGLPGGLAIYGKKFGRYPLDPTLVFESE